MNSMTQQVPWSEGEVKVVQGVPFTYTTAARWGGDHAPRWHGMPLAHNVFVIDPMDAQRGPLNFRVDGVRFYHDAFERAFAKAIKWRLHQVSRARRTVAEYDAAELAAKVRSVARSAEQTFGVVGLAQAVELHVAKLGGARGQA